MKGRGLCPLRVALAGEQRRGAVAQRVVQTLQDFSSTVAGPLEVGHQEVLQHLLVQEIRDSRQQHRPGTHLQLRLAEERRS